MLPKIFQHIPHKEKNTLWYIHTQVSQSGNLILMNLSKNIGILKFQQFFQQYLEGFFYPVKNVSLKLLQSIIYLSPLSTGNNNSHSFFLNIALLEKPYKVLFYRSSLNSDLHNGFSFLTVCWVDSGS